MLAVLVLLTITAFGTHVGSRYCPRRVASPPVDTVVQKFGGTSVADADRIREVVCQTVKIDQSELLPGISIGVASKEDGMANADALMAAADRALYAAKQNGRDRTCLNAGGKLMLNRP